MENSASSDNIELNIEKLPDAITSDSPALAGDNLEAAQIATAIAVSKLEKQEGDTVISSPEDSSTDDEDSHDLLKRPNNMPCQGFHKEIVKKKGTTNRIHIYIYPPAEHADIIRKAINDDKIKNKRGLGLYLAELKKQGLPIPAGCSKESFGTFYTKATSLSGIDKELFEAYREADEDEQSIDSADAEDGEDDDDQMYKKLSQVFQKKEYILNLHPEVMQINFDELLALSNVVRDAEGRIIDPLHQTIPFLTKYERTKILGVRSKQLNCGAKPFIKKTEDMIDGYTIAVQELKEGKIPFIIRRPLPNGASEYWKIDDLERLY
jgi:DNA-directed RNA polymerase I, II, and III subunit RPABC2